ncbi:MAG: hypothetical protein U9R07_12415 [Pseudomonadota bacterium]|nr:hypothetical protein [Pseudomonadota bacterium]
MSTRISSLAIALLLTACGPAAEDAAPQAKAETIWCGLDGATELTQACTLERGNEEGRPAFVVRHPDGKFRRLVASADGQNLLAADGADQSQSALKGDRWEVILGDDRYVVPVKVDAPKP